MVNQVITVNSNSAVASEIDVITRPQNLPLSRKGIYGTQVFPDVTFILPTKNEEKNLPLVLPLIPAEAEVILVDGHSTDKTIEVARKLRPNIRIFTQTGTGKGNAMRCGFQNATRDIVITYDADGSFNHGEIARFVLPLREGFDLVKGSRFAEGGATTDMPRFRRFGNWVFTKLTNLFFGTHYTDLAYGFHAFRRSMLREVELESDGFEIDTEMFIKAQKADLKILEVPSIESTRVHGQGKLKSLPDGYRILRTIMKEFITERPRAIVISAVSVITAGTLLVIGLAAMAQ